MNIALKIKELLDKESIAYEVLEHNPAFTASEIAEAQHLPGHQVVKSVILNADGKWILCMLPATHKIDFEKLKRAFKLTEVSLANEGIMAVLFPGCEVGAMPPFGQLARMPVFVECNLLENEAVAFNAGTHTELLKMRFKDFMRLVKPISGDFSIHI